MGSLALSRVAAQDPAPTITDEVARLARQELAPLASAIDAGSVYPGEFLRRLGKTGAWSSHVPQEGPADLRWAIQSMAALG
ncbi:alkylation response protein AidB-like acyl-CoA dehydrogenase [Bradyrhizobium sp. USDA 3240]